MSLNPKDLAEKINEAMGATDKDGKKINVTPEMLLYATSIITTLIATVTVHLPGTVQGTAPPAPGPVPDLQATNGLFLPPLAPNIWSGINAVGPNAQPEALASCAYITGAAKITFGVGNMQGQSTAAPGTPPSPGVLVAGAGTGGQVTELVGKDWAQLVAAPVGGDPALSEKIYTAIVDYISENAEVIYIPQGVNGAFAAPSTPLIAGLGAGGLLT